MKIVYIAGAYSSNTINGVFDNVIKARKTAIKYFRKGYGFICPHTNSIFMDGLGGLNDADQWYKMDLELIKRLKPTMVMMKGWKKSRGARAEHELAKQLKLKILYEN